MSGNIEKLLYDIADITKKHDTIARATGANFNVFESLDATGEIAICRMLFLLLNPQGSHGQGAVFLKAFFNTVLKDINIDESELDSATVTREHSIENQRRIDLYIETQSWAIPIEVKIFAPDQKSQCLDYQRYAADRKKNYMMYYLTRKVSEPSEESVRHNELLIDKENLKNITFAEDILEWLEICVSGIALTLAPIREVLLQFMAAIRRFSNKLEDNYMNDIAKILMSSSENMASAKNIAAGLDECRLKIMQKLFLEIERRVPHSKLHNEYDWDFSGKNAKCSLDNYPKKYCYPGISYYYKDFAVNGKNISVWVRCEIDPNGNFFVGLCTLVDGIKGNNEAQVFKENDLIKHGIQTKDECTHANFIYEWTKPDWWLYWDYVYAQNGEPIDFKEANSAAYFSLFDAKSFDYVAENSAKAINGFLSR